MEEELFDGKSNQQYCLMLDMTNVKPLECVYPVATHVQLASMREKLLNISLLRTILA